MSEYVIYGVNRVSKDFLYIFNDLNILYFVEDSLDIIREFEGLPVYPVKKMISDIKKGKAVQIIVCDSKKEGKVDLLEKLGFTYGKEFVFEEDFFQSLDKYCLNPKNKKMVAWGVGKRAAKLGPFYGIHNFNYFIDKRKVGEFYENTGIRIFTPDEVDEWQNIFVVITVANNNEIIEYLEGYGLKHYDDFCTMGEFLTQPSTMLRRTIFSASCYDVECKTLFNHIELAQSGIVNVCCVPFVVGEIGNIEKNSIDEIWNGIVHKIMCLSINNRTYAFCNPDLCPIFIDRKKDAPIDLNRKYLTMEKKPRNLLVNFEDSCNLICESCRDHLKIAQGNELSKNLRYAEILNREIVPYIEFITMAGTGEVFVGKGYEKMYTDDAINNIKWFRLLTNGMLFNKKNWEKLSRGKDNAKFILTVSVDAATKETYEILRKNGNFDVLKKNMEYASELRKWGQLAYFRLNFVVQSKNYKEMPLFVKWGLELGVDEVFFTKILNYGTYTQEEFADISMMEADGMTAKKELKEILDLPIMQEEIVDLGTIRYGNKAIGLDYIENYYRWELERKVPYLFDLSYRGKEDE